jgi:hypothetical protein
MTQPINIWRGPLTPTATTLCFERCCVALNDARTRDAGQLAGEIAAMALERRGDSLGFEVARILLRPGEAIPLCRAVDVWASTRNPTPEITEVEEVERCPHGLSFMVACEECVTDNIMEDEAKARGETP